jgi:hypothetical protein
MLVHVFNYLFKTVTYLFYYTKLDLENKVKIFKIIVKKPPNNNNSHNF